VITTDQAKALAAFTTMWNWMERGIEPKGWGSVVEVKADPEPYKPLQPSSPSPMGALRLYGPKGQVHMLCRAFETGVEVCIQIDMKRDDGKLVPTLAWAKGDPGSWECTHMIVDLKEPQQWPWLIEHEFDTPFTPDMKEDLRYHLTYAVMAVSTLVQ